ncbi:MAG: hypothetical protein IJI08_08590 [Clostridia bacterium]|nr:hypothetical protein [Clostridia bacterium]
MTAPASLSGFSRNHFQASSQDPARSLTRDLRLFADGWEIGHGCPMVLTARETLTLRPALHRLEIRNLSDSAEAMLSAARNLEVRSGASVLAFGEPVEVLTRPVSGSYSGSGGLQAFGGGGAAGSDHSSSGAPASAASASSGGAPFRLTEIVFSPGLSLWRSTVSLSVAGGMTLRDTVRALLAASGTGIPLAAWTGSNPALTRPQAFFGRTCDALTLLAETADADAHLTAAGLILSGRERRDPSSPIPESLLPAVPIRTGNRLLLTTAMLGWPLGTFVRVSWHGVAWTGRLVSRLIQADNREGPWKSELEIELSED